MWVWIPRFNAVVPTAGNKNNPPAIDITFVNDSESAIDAFMFGQQKLNGFWYAKFELGNESYLEGANNRLNCIDNSCSNSNLLLIKPNVVHIENQDIFNYFYAARSMKQENNAFGFDTKSSTLDIHVSKNNEWGAVAYLTQSIYGRCTSSTSCTEVFFSNASKYTGRSCGAAGGYCKTIFEQYPNEALESETTIHRSTGYYTYNDFKINYDKTISTTKEIGAGTGASTTGNIYGIYDMSGGFFEYVMGNYNGIVGTKSGFSTLPDNKYYNMYTTTSFTGHALTETKGWYGDSLSLPTEAKNFFQRGAAYYSGTVAGIFYGYANAANAHAEYSTRFALVP